MIFESDKDLYEKYKTNCLLSLNLIKDVLVHLQTLHEDVKSAK